MTHLRSLRASVVFSALHPDLCARLSSRWRSISRLYVCPHERSAHLLSELPWPSLSGSPVPSRVSTPTARGSIDRVSDARASQSLSRRRRPLLPKHQLDAAYSAALID